MKFIHLADLHIGKRIVNYQLLEDQRYVLDQILEEAEKFKPDCFLISGDIFDRSVPSEDAIALYNEYITKFSELGDVFIIAGNHDSGERLGLFNNFLEKSNIFIEGNYQGDLKKIIKKYGNDNVNIYLLPFFTRSEVKFYKGDSIDTDQKALEAVLEDEVIDQNEINILLSHQFYSSTSKSNELPEIGSLSPLNIECLKEFDYVALGHLHNQQKVGEDYIRYCGTPMKYNQKDNEKYLNLITLEKNSLNIEQKLLHPLRDIVYIKDYFNNLINLDEKNNNFAIIELLDNSAIPNVKASLLEKFPNIVQIKFSYENSNSYEAEYNEYSTLSPIELLEEFINLNRGSFKESQRKLAQELFEEIEKDMKNEADLT